MTLPIPVGTRVAILGMIQSVTGPAVTPYRGTVTRHVEYWTGIPEYVVKIDGGGELVYRPYLVTPEF